MFFECKFLWSGHWTHARIHHRPNCQCKWHPSTESNCQNFVQAISAFAAHHIYVSLSISLELEQDIRLAPWRALIKVMKFLYRRVLSIGDSIPSTHWEFESERNNKETLKIEWNLNVFSICPPIDDNPQMCTFNSNPEKSYSQSNKKREKHSWR